MKDLLNYKAIASADQPVDLTKNFGGVPEAGGQTIINVGQAT